MARRFVVRSVVVSHLRRASLSSARLPAAVEPTARLGGDNDARGGAAVRAHAGWGVAFAADGGALWAALAAGGGPPPPRCDAALGHAEFARDDAEAEAARAAGGGGAVIDQAQFANFG